MKNKKQLTYIFAAGISVVVLLNLFKIIWVNGLDSNNPFSFEGLLSSESLIFIGLAVFLSIVIGFIVYRKIK